MCHHYLLAETACKAIFVVRTADFINDLFMLQTPSDSWITNKHEQYSPMLRPSCREVSRGELKDNEDS